MSALEKRTWLGLLSICLPYLVYFTILLIKPDFLSTTLGKFGLLAAVACTHAIAYIAGLLWIKYKERGEKLLQDERDQAIDARATRIAYFIMMTGLIIVGMVKPFEYGGWDIVNRALFFIVISEAVRQILTLNGYRKHRLAY